MNDNFESADVAFWDVDNSGTDDPGKWITPEKIGEQIHSRDSSGHLPMSLASSIEFTVSDKADANGQPGPESHGCVNFLRFFPLEPSALHRQLHSSTS